MKLALAGPDGSLLELRKHPAPRPRGEGLARTLDVEAYRAVAESLFEGLPAGLPLGIASQRSSFVLWDPDGTPKTPLVSWQDRSAEPWCRAHAAEADELARASGLVLSPHYAGPKLAALFEREVELARRARDGELRFGTLESFLVWHWSEGRAHETDLSMAARTLLVELGGGDWSGRLAESFGVPLAMLGEVAPSLGRSTRLLGPVGERPLAASLADQPAGLVASLGCDPGGALVNLGTGVFCLLPVGGEPRRSPGYLAGPLLARGGGNGLEGRYALEGTVNGGGATADREAAGPTELPPRDPNPEAFCLPDENGVGAPHWRARQAFALEAGAHPLSPADRRRAVLEGLVFRAASILDELAPASLGDASGLERVLVSGGLANEPFVPAALAATLGRPVEVLEEEESTLTGAARLALGLDPLERPAVRTRTVPPPPAGAWPARQARALASVAGRAPRPGLQRVERLERPHHVGRVRAAAELACRVHRELGRAHVRPRGFRGARR